jgi:sporadic carbohydrate cluster 2OG-Fe(II) oxygenase
MNTSPGFFETGEYELAESFLKEGFVIKAVEDPRSLEQIRQLATTAAGEYLGVERYKPDEFLNSIHREITAENLNDLRLSIINKINTNPASRPQYYSLARKLLAALVGNELAMQLRLNLSIQLPGDDSSLLPVHADVWSGDSPYEVVLWLPLVDCFGSKSMFLLPPKHTQSLHECFSNYREKSSEDLYQDIKADLQWIEIKYGEILVFNQNLPHGNRVNEEDETRWSLNCRFKSVFSPYGDKKLGEFFEPITLRSASRIGMQYRYPKIQ